MTQEEKAEELGKKYSIPCRGIGDCEFEATQAALEMAQWRDKQSDNWHKVADGDLPKEGGNYWCKLKGKYSQGSSHYKQHCNNGYCILQWLPKKKAWNVRYNTEVEAWIELPEYKEE